MKIIMINRCSLSLCFPLLVLLCWLMLTVTHTWLPLHANHINLEQILQPPSLQAWLGYDELGRNVLHRLLDGASVSFWVALWVNTIAVVVGTVIGTLSAWYGGWTDKIIIHIMDIFLAFPGILLAIALAGVLGPGINNLVIALSVVGWVGFARLARAQTLSLKQREHILAARALGATTPRILTVHLMPLLMAPLIVEVTFGIAAVVIAEAGLSFLGLGIQPPDASWGNMLRDGSRYMLMAPHLVFAPGITLLLVVLSVNLLGDRLRDHLDVKKYN